MLSGVRSRRLILPRIDAISFLAEIDDRRAIRDNISKTGNHARGKKCEMDALDYARSMADGGRVQELAGKNYRLFRIMRPEGSSLLKVYNSPSWSRREERALNAVQSLSGTPRLIERGAEGDMTWVRLEDPGSWTLATLPENSAAAHRAGEILRSLHSSDPGDMTNLSGGMTSETVESEYTLVFERLERYRRRIQVPRSVLEQALAAPKPKSSTPCSSHTQPLASKFFVDNDGEVTLMDWGWATVSPPEWDYSLAWWSIMTNAGSAAATAMGRGYGAELGDDVLQPWVVFHLGTNLLQKAESTSGHFEELENMVRELTAVLG